MDYDIAIIGAGQAGLALGYYLRNKNLSYSIIDAEKRIGDNWRNRYDCLVLFTPRQYSMLPGLKMTGDPNGYPAKDEVGDYLETYVTRFKLPILLNTFVEKVTKDEDRFRVVCQGNVIAARNVVIATGHFQVPFMPPFHMKLARDVLQIHSKDYKHPTQIPKGNIVVVGAGNSGSQIALDLATTHQVNLSAGHKPTFLPQRLLSRSGLWWLDKFGLLHLAITSPKHSPIGQFLMKHEGSPIIGTELKRAIKNGAVSLKSQLVDADGSTVQFADGTSMPVDAIVWATGFKHDFSWIIIDHVLDQAGEPIHHRGATNVEGLYFLGLRWQYTRGSDVFVGIAHDASYIADQILEKLKRFGVN